MQRTVGVVLLVLIGSFAVHAEEGMWLPEQLPRIGDRLQAAGLDTSPESFGDLTGDPMGAIVSLGGCSASFVSPHGLVITNHHCAYGTIQHNSTEENNLMENGFLAGDREHELAAAPGSRVLVTVAVEDVTEKLLAGVPPGADGASRYSAIENAEKVLIAGCEEQAGHRCKVASFFGGATFRLYKQLEIRDVRLVYAPPSSVGNYGGDVDNWMWPRHTGDYSFYRAWVGPDGLPADPAPENIPYRPEHWLEIGSEGVAEGDFVMVVGYPGSTGRYRLASEVAEAITWSYPQKIQRRQESLAIIARETEGRPQATIAYAAVNSYLNNGLKNAQGMLAGFARSGSVQRKHTLEAELQAWINDDPERQDRWGGALSDLEALLEEQRRHRARDQELGSLAFNQMFSAASTAYRLAREREKPDAERKLGYQERDMRRIQGRILRRSRMFDAQVDRALLQHNLEGYAALPADQRLPDLDAWFGLDPDAEAAAAISSKVDVMYAETALDDVEARVALLELDRGELEASEDPFVQMAIAIFDTDLALEAEQEDLAGRLMEARPRFLKAHLEFRRARGEEIYPDANGTLRVTFGNVIGYTPADAVRYLPFTTAEGVAAKATDAKPFNAPAGLLDAIAGKEYGPYANEAVGSVPVNFLSSVDTTGGNSGSATLDAEGRLVGLLFDGNWESMISDWDFLPEVTRSIHVDVRYVLWVMDRVHAAAYLLQEMGVEPAFASD